MALSTPMRVSGVTAVTIRRRAGSVPIPTSTTGSRRRISPDVTVSRTNRFGLARVGADGGHDVVEVDVRGDGAVPLPVVEVGLKVDLTG